MTTNRDWLFSLPLEEQYAWMNAEHQERALDGDAAAQDGDSRDKLEADVRKIAEAYNMDTQRHGTERFAHELYYSIIHLLDRQAAITERECRKPNWDYCETCETLAELTAERDELKAELIDERGKLNRKMNALREVTRDYRNERDHYRSKFGKCIDYADAIHALMDDEGMA